MCHVYRVTKSGSECHLKVNKLKRKQAEDDDEDDCTEILHKNSIYIYVWIYMYMLDIKADWWRYGTTDIRQLVFVLQPLVLITGVFHYL